MFMNTLLNSSSITGSTCVPAAWRALRGANAAQFEAARGRHRRPPTRLDHGGGIAVGENGRAVDLAPARNASTRNSRAARQPAGSSSARQYMLTTASRPRSRSERAHRRSAALPVRPACARRATPASAPAAMHSTDTDSITKRLMRHQKGETAAIALLESLANLRHGCARRAVHRQIDAQRRVGALVADVDAGHVRSSVARRMSPCAVSSSEASARRTAATLPRLVQPVLIQSRSTALSRMAIWSASPIP